MCVFVLKTGVCREKSEAKGVTRQLGLGCPQGMLCILLIRAWVALSLAECAMCGG